MLGTRALSRFITWIMCVEWKCNVLAPGEVQTLRDINKGADFRGMCALFKSRRPVWTVTTSDSTPSRFLAFSLKVILLKVVLSNSSSGFPKVSQRVSLDICWFFTNFQSSRCTWHFIRDILCLCAYYAPSHWPVNHSIKNTKEKKEKAPNSTDGVLCV